MKPSAKDFNIGQRVRNIVRFGSMEYDAVVVRIGERELVVRNVGAADTGSIFYHTMQTVIGHTIIAKGAVHNQSKSPDLVGVQEASEILGWDKRKLATYLSRGKFPEPIQRLASGSIWTRQQIVEFAETKKAQKD